MSYLVLARKYRPAAFDEVVAQDLVVSTLKNAIERGKVSHAYLFTGPRGSGKTTVARILAKALNCEKGPTAKPCNVCPRCRDITAGVSLDVIEIDGASHNSVDDVRELNENVRYATAGGRRIYIIDEVHMLSGAAFNALLKTLEEPPPHAVFVLATTEVSKIPATILSRCQRFDFRRIPPPALTSTLQNICAKEGIEVEPEALAILVRKADGSLRDGLSLLDQVWTLSGGRITKEKVEQALGLLGLEVFFELTDALAQKDAARTLSVFDRVMEKGADVEDFLDQLLYHLRNLLVARLKEHSEELLPFSETERQEYAGRARQFAEGDVLRMMKAVSDLKLNLSRLADPKILVEAELVKLAWLDSTVELKEVLENLEEGGGLSSSGSAPKRSFSGNPPGSFPTAGGASAESSVRASGSGGRPSVSRGPQSFGSGEPSPKTAPPAVFTPPGKAVEGTVWRQVLDRMRKENPGDVIFLEQSQPYFSEKDELILPFGRSYEAIVKKKFGGVGNGRKILDEVLSDVLGRRVVLKIEFVANGPAAAPVAPAAASARISVADWLEKHPDWKEIWDKLQLEAIERKPNTSGAN
ncbi:MAG: DNA polymerase III subunit gamma/tau [candidate division Zixibacteria bacterium]|nr:DNA polymerase III subunit gamma/tau [candidate division Zixibacteria bacterium]